MTVEPGGEKAVRLWLVSGKGDDGYGRRCRCRGWTSIPVHLETADANDPMDDCSDMRITYRGTGGLGALIAFVAIALAAGVLTAAVAVVVLVGIAGAALPRAWRRRTAQSATKAATKAATDWPHDTIEGTVVESAVSGPPHRAEEVRPLELTPVPARSRPARAEGRVS